MKRSAEDMLSSDKTDRLSAEQATSSASSSSSSSTATAAAAALALHTMSGSAASSSSAALGPGPSFASTSTAPESSSSAQRRKLDAASTSASASSSSCGMDDQRHLAHTGSCKKIDDASSATAGAGMVSITATELHMDLDSPSDVEPPSELCSNPAAVAASAPMKEKEVRVEDAKAGPDAVAAAAKKDAQLELIIDELVCDICLELMVNPAALTPCQHVFCWSCAKVWMQDSSKCPTCATPITHAHLNHKLAKLAELAVSLAPADRIRPTVEIEAAKTRLEQHKALLGSSTIRAMARVEAEDPYRPDLTIYWPCLACRPGNRSGFQCTFRIPTPATGSPPARGAHWPLIEEADEDGLANVDHHDSCSGCYAWIPLMAPGIVSRCTACSEASCHPFDPQGSCPAGFDLYKLDDELVGPRLDEHFIFNNIPLAGFNEVDKELLMRYVREKDVAVKTILAGIVRIAKREHDASVLFQAGSSMIQPEEHGASSSSDANRHADPESVRHRGEDEDSDSRATARVDLARNVVRFETTRTDQRLQAPHPLGVGQSAGSSGSAAAGSLTSYMLRPIVKPLPIQGHMAEILATSSFCVDCMQGIIGHFAVWWWMEERPKALKEIGVPGKVDCELGLDCNMRTYRLHAEQKNHICMQKPKSSTSSSQPATSGSGSNAAASSSKAGEGRTMNAGEGESSGAATAPQTSSYQLRSRASTVIGRSV